MERTFLNDGFNSLVQVALGMAAAYWPEWTYYICAGFTIYQVSTFVEKNDNVFIDMSEFILGFATIKLY